MEKLAATISEAARILKDRAARYGNSVMEKTAVLASLKLNQEIDAYTVAIVLESLKDVRRAIEPQEPEHHLDGLNYRVIAASLKPERPPRSHSGNGVTPTSGELTDAMQKRLASDLEKDMGE